MAEPFKDVLKPGVTLIDRRGVEWRRVRPGWRLLESANGEAMPFAEVVERYGTLGPLTGPPWNPTPGLALRIKPESTDPPANVTRGNFGGVVMVEFDWTDALDALGQGHTSPAIAKVRQFMAYAGVTGLPLHPLEQAEAERMRSGAASYLRLADEIEARATPTEVGE